MGQGSSNATKMARSNSAPQSGINGQLNTTMGGKNNAVNLNLNLNASMSLKKRKLKGRSDVALSAAQVRSSSNFNESLLPLHYNDAQVAEILHDAVHRRDEELIIKVFFKYSDGDYTRLASTFLQQYSIDIVTLCFQQVGEDVSECVRLRLEPRINSICRRINVDLKEKPEGYVMAILEIVLGYWELDLNELKTAFQSLQKVSLKSAIRQHIKEPYIVEILTGILDEGAINDQSTMVRDGIDGLMQAIRTDNLFEGERYFYKLMCSRSREQLKDIFEGFLQIYQHDITTEIHRHYTTGGPGSTRDYLDAITRILRHGQNYFCNLIHSTLKLPDSDQMKHRKLIFAVMSRTDYALREVKNDYRKVCCGLMVDDIKERVQDPAVRLALIKVLSRIN